MECSFQLLPTDRDAFSKAVGSRISLWVIALAPCFVFFFTFLSDKRFRVRLMSGNYHPSWAEIASIVLPIILFCVFFVIVVRSNRTGLNKESPQVVIRADDEGISGTTDKGRDSLFWNSVVNIIETETHFFVLNGPRRGLIVPKRAFSGDGAAQFGDFIKSKWAPHRKNVAPIAEVGNSA